MALVYVAGPYTSGDPVLNTRRAAEVGLRIHEETGAGVLIPHVTLLTHAMFPRDLDFWYRFDLAQVDHCTHMVRISGTSTGADAEVAHAEALGVPVFYDADELIAALRPSSPSGQTTGEGE